MPIIPLSCPFCGGSLTVNSEHDAAVCSFCGKPFVIKDAIVNTYIQNVTNIHAETVNVFAETDFEIESGVLKRYRGESPHVTVPDVVKVIGPGAFKGLLIESVLLPDSVREIQISAFDGCKDLTQVNIPAGVTSIGESAFQGCTGLTSVTIPDSVMTIGIRAFASCTSLRSVIIPGSVKEIGWGAFQGCSALTSVTIPDSVMTIEILAFASCTSLRSVIIPAGVTSIGDFAFRECTSLTNVTIPAGVTRIGESTFAGCTGLTSVTIPDSVKEIGWGAFHGCGQIAEIQFSRYLKDFVRAFEDGSPGMAIVASHYKNMCPYCGSGDLTAFGKCRKCGHKKNA